MRVLLTGASGFVGSHVLRHFLLNTDWEFICPVTYQHKGVPDRIKVQTRNIDEDFSRVELIKYDLTNEFSAVFKRELGDIDYIVNLASESHVDRSIVDPAPFIQNNVSLICNLLEYARAAKIKKFLHISTDEVYGPAYDHAHKEWETLKPSNPYSASKAAQEGICQSYWRTYDVPVLITNSMNIIGEMQDPEKFVPMITRKVMAGETVQVHASPEGEPGSRFYLHARNQADALLHILTKADFSTIDKFNVVGDQEINNLELAQMIAEIMGKPLKHEFSDFHSSRPGHDLRYALDGQKLADAGWTAPIKFRESLEQTIEWTLRNPSWMEI